VSRIEWDTDKANRNLSKHAVDFEEAATVLFDPLAIHRIDEPHSAAELRFAVVGVSLAGRALVVIYTDDGSTIRLISARRATKRERHEYESAE
jgi:uncharacterized DUF497 family protein